MKRHKAAKNRKNALPEDAPDLLPDGPVQEGIVIRSTGSWYKVRMQQGEVLDCRLRGKLRIAGDKSTNPVAVGDHVEIMDSEEGAVITERLPRRNHILRKSVNLSKRMHVLCANVDQALLLFTLDSPVTTLGYIDRLIVTCEAFEIPVVLLFNKADLLTEARQQQRLRDYIAIYEGLGYPCIPLNATDLQYRERMQDLLRDKVSVVLGRSGAGKSSCINLADPGLELKTGTVSDFNQRGKHTTTFAEMFELAFGGYIIDSPGFREMETWDISRDELSHFYREMRARIGDCKFNNCIHREEPGCAVRAAVERGEIPESRYHTYLGMLADIEAQGPAYHIH